MIGIGVRVLFLRRSNWINPRHHSWQADLEGILSSTCSMSGSATPCCGMVEGLHRRRRDDRGRSRARSTGTSFAWFTGLPLLLQAFLISFIFDFGQYWMHRGMHNWYPLWLTHAPHHYITQLNINKGAVGNPVELFLIGLGIGGFFDFLPRAVLLAGTLGLAVGSYQHINTRFNTPRWWRFLFNTTEHHSVHHSQDYEGSRSNFSGTWIIIDRMFGTCVDGEAELLGMEGGRKMSIRETMHYPFSEGWKSTKAFFQRRQQLTAVPAE